VLAIESVVDALAEARHTREVRFVLFDNAALAVFLDAAREVAHRRQANWRLDHITGSMELSNETKKNHRRQLEDVQNG